MKVYLGMCQLHIWIEQVRYTIHWRWVVVDLFYAWVDYAAAEREIDEAKMQKAEDKYLSGLLEQWKAYRRPTANDDSAAAAAAGGPPDVSRTPLKSAEEVEALLEEKVASIKKDLVGADPSRFSQCVVCCNRRRMLTTFFVSGRSKTMRTGWNSSASSLSSRRRPWSSSTTTKSRRCDPNLQFKTPAAVATR